MIIAEDRLHLCSENKFYSARFALSLFIVCKYTTYFFVRRQKTTIFAQKIYLTYALAGGTGY